PSSQAVYGIRLHSSSLQEPVVLEDTVCRLRFKLPHISRYSGYIPAKPAGYRTYIHYCSWSRSNFRVNFPRFSAPSYSSSFRVSVTSKYLLISLCPVHSLLASQPFEKIVLQVVADNFSLLIRILLNNLNLKNLLRSLSKLTHAIYWSAGYSD